MDEPYVKNLRAIAGRIPENAVTDWLLASAPAHIKTHTGKLILSSHNAITNMAWAQEEIKTHNLHHPSTPFYLHTSCKNADYICICKKGPRNEKA